MKRVGCQDLEIFGLLKLYHLKESLTDLPVGAAYVMVFVKGCPGGPPLILELHVHLSNAIDSVYFLPNELEVGFVVLLRC